MIEEGLVDRNPLYDSSKNLNNDTEDFETHRVSSPKESMKYNLRSRTKGTLDFHGKEIGGLMFLDEPRTKRPSQGKEIPNVFGLKTSFLRNKSGKQLSLIGALRENSPKEGSK
jgi:hypothetical protein